MIILGIETSCDETAISIIEAEGKIGHDFRIKILANEVLSQIALHREYGGVFPSLAKREHAKNLVPLFLEALEHSHILKNVRMSTVGPKNIPEGQDPSVYSNILKNIGIDGQREPEMWEMFFKEIPKLKKPPIDALAVTMGPGLEPALWVGINFARALSKVWNIPLVPINHMEGHLFASLLRNEGASPAPSPLAAHVALSTVRFPSLALLVSGGHTELIKIDDWFKYEKIGQTLDDAVGEAFDKVARILDLPYPGGPEISGLAEKWRTSNNKSTGIKFPRPMSTSPDLNFSFSGLKTSVLYKIKKIQSLTPEIKAEIAAGFEEAAIDSIIIKTKKAMETHRPFSLIVGGGVAANLYLRRKLEELARRLDTELFISLIPHSTDNALMIALAAAARASFGKISHFSTIEAAGNLPIDKNIN